MTRTTAATMAAGVVGSADVCNLVALIIHADVSNGITAQGLRDLRPTCPAAAAAYGMLLSGNALVIGEYTLETIRRRLIKGSDGQARTNSDATMIVAALAALIVASGGVVVATAKAKATVPMLVALLPAELLDPAVVAGQIPTERSLLPGFEDLMVLSAVLVGREMLGRNHEAVVLVSNDERFSALSQHLSMFNAMISSGAQFIKRAGCLSA